MKQVQKLEEKPGDRMEWKDNQEELFEEKKLQVRMEWEDNQVLDPKKQTRNNGSLEKLKGEWVIQESCTFCDHFFKAKLSVQRLQTSVLM